MTPVPPTVEPRRPARHDRVVPGPPAGEVSSARVPPVLAIVAVLAATTMALPGPGAAQQPDEDQVASWPAPAVGVRFGYDQSARGEIVGGQIRVPVLPSARIELVPSSEVTFLSGLRDYSFNMDAVYVSGGRQGGVYLGGGFSLRSSIFVGDGSGERETKTGLNGVVGVQGGGPGPLETQVEFRWTFLRGVDYDPRAITIGVNLPLWGWPSAG